MRNQRLILRVVLLLIAVWAVVLGVRAIAGSKRVTAERVEQTIAAQNLADWSEGAPAGVSPGARSKQIREVAGLVNRLDFQERQKARDQRIGEAYFRKLTPSEKSTFVELTVEKSMENFMRALDGMDAEQRRKFVEDGLREIEQGRTAAEIDRMRELSDDMLARITDEGMKAYYRDADADTKLDLAPLMEAMDGLVKGLSGNEFGPSSKR